MQELFLRECAVISDLHLLLVFEVMIIVESAG